MTDGGLNSAANKQTQSFENRLKEYVSSRLNNEETWRVSGQYLLPTSPRGNQKLAEKNPKHYGIIRRKNKSKKSSDVSGCDFQKHGNKTPGKAWQGVGGRKKKRAKAEWQIKWLFAVEFKSTDFQSAACQDAFFFIVLPSMGPLPTSLFPFFFLLSPPPILPSLPTISLPFPPPLHYHTPLKSIARIKLLFIPAPWQSWDWGDLCVFTSDFGCHTVVIVS